MGTAPAEQVADVISALAKVAWPAAVVVLLLSYRESVQGLFGRRGVSRLSVGPVSAEFSEVARSVEAAASEAGISEPATGELALERALVEELARADPRAAVATSWARVRDASGIAVARRTDEPVAAATVRKLEQLQSHNLLTPEMVDLGRTLKTMETTVLSRPEIAIPVDFARVFSVAAVSLAKRINELIPEGYEGPSGATGSPPTPWSPSAPSFTTPAPHLYPIPPVTSAPSPVPPGAGDDPPPGSEPPA